MTSPLGERAVGLSKFDSLGHVLGVRGPSDGLSRIRCRVDRLRPQPPCVILVILVIVATIIALIVCIRFSAWSKTIEASTRRRRRSPRAPSRPNRSYTSIADGVSRSWNAGRQCMNLTRGFPVARKHFRVDLVRREQLDPLGPDLLGLTHRHPHIGVDEVDAVHSLSHVLGEHDPGTGLGELRPRFVRRRNPSATASFGATIRTSMPSMAPVTSSELPMLLRASPT